MRTSRRSRHPASGPTSTRRSATTTNNAYRQHASDVAWDSSYLRLEPPEHIYSLDDLGANEDAAPFRFAITSPFRMLADDGVAVLQTICAELRAHARATTWTATQSVGAVYQSEFLLGLARDPTLARFLAEISGAPLEPQPIAHHAVVVNYPPRDLARELSPWHRDATSFAYVLMVSDPRPLQGGRYEYFVGSLAEGIRMVRSGQGIPPERAQPVEFPGAGWAILQQGHRVLHRVSRLERRCERTTLVSAYWAAHPEISDPVGFDHLRKAYGEEVALREWRDYVAAISARGDAFVGPLAAARAQLEQALGDGKR